MPRAVVTGGAGFLGSHLGRAFLAREWEVVAIDNLLTGSRANVEDLATNPAFELLEHDVTAGLPVNGAVDAVLHFASPASPPAYLAHPIETLSVGSIGTHHALELARANSARFLLASTSEVYGDPLEHPQTEVYRGNVSPVGPRSVYDEAKRYAEAVTMAYRRTFDVNTAIVRIFNTFGPRLAPGDGRVVSNFVVQARDGRPLTVYGDGKQTRSFAYADDTVRGVLALLDSDFAEPVNIGSPEEHTVLELAELVLEITGSHAPVEFDPLPVDDPVRRCPDIALAQRVLGWQPEVPLRDGLARTVDWFQRQQR
jgi:dTDP-glucose 4,6-dehydratase